MRNYVNNRGIMSVFGRCGVEKKNIQTYFGAVRLVCVDVMPEFQLCSCG